MRASRSGLWQWSLAGACACAGLVLIGTQYRTLAQWLYLGTEIRSVEGIMDNAVVQRGPDGRVRIEVFGRTELLADEIVAAVSSEENVVRRADWALVDSSPSVHFAGLLAIPAGQHFLFLRSRSERGDRTLPPLRIGVGEVFIVAGQSNAEGSCPTLFAPKSGRVRTAEVDEAGHIVGWRIGSDPQQPNSRGSVWPEVGDRLTRRLGVPVGFVNVAAGGSSIDDWLPGTRNFERLVQVASELGHGGFKAVLWHQGETDAGRRMAGTEYHAKLARLIDSFRTKTEAGTDWLVAAASCNNALTAGQIRHAQQTLWWKSIALPGPDTDVLGPNYRLPDGVRFNESGTRAAAEMWARALTEGLFSRRDGNLAAQRHAGRQEATGKPLPP